MAKDPKFVDPEEELGGLLSKKYDLEDLEFDEAKARKENPNFDEALRLNRQSSVAENMLGIGNYTSSNQFIIYCEKFTDFMFLVEPAREFVLQGNPASPSMPILVKDGGRGAIKITALSALRHPTLLLHILTVHEGNEFKNKEDVITYFKTKGYYVIEGELAFSNSR